MKKWYVKPLRKLLLFIAILPPALLALLHLPPVQQQLLRSITSYLYQTTHYHITCDAFRLTWLRHIALENLTVTDPQDKPLLAIHGCTGRLNLFSLLLLKPDMIDSVSLTGGKLYLEKNSQEDFNIAAFYNKVLLPFLPETDTDLLINKIQLGGVNLYYHNQINKQALKVENINLAISHFLSSSDHHSGTLTTFSYQETSDLPVTCKNLMTQFSITPHSVVLKDCHFITKYSSLHGDFTVQYAKKLPLVADQEGRPQNCHLAIEFQKRSIALDATLHQSALSSIELSRFSDFFKGEHMFYKLDGSISLTPYAMTWKNCKLVFGDSYIQGTGSYNGLDGDLFVQAGRIYMHDLQKKPAAWPTPLQYIGIANAKLLGNTQAVKLTGDITTNIGAVQTDLTLHHLGKPIQHVTGNLTLHKVAIEALLPALPIQSLSGTVAIKAQGTHLNTLDAAAKLTEIEVHHYKYKKIEASCIVSNAMATFKLHSKDPHAKLTVAGTYHMAKSLKADGIIEQVDLEKLGFVSDPLSFSTKFSFKIRDILTKRPRGKIVLNQCIIQGLAKKVACNQVAIRAIAHGSKDLVTITSPLIDCRLEGIFTINDLASHINHLIRRFKNPADRSTILAQLHLDYVIDCKKILPILNWFAGDLYIAPSTTFLGHFAYDQDYHFSLRLPSASTLSCKQFSLEKLKVKLNAHHLMDAKKRLVQLYIASDKQDWCQAFQTDRLSLQLLMDKNEFTILNSLSSYGNHLSVACSGRLTDSAIQIDLLPSSLTTKDKIWTIHTERTSCISKLGIAIGNLSIISGQSSICVGGQLTQLPTTDPLRCTIRHLALNYASAVGPLKGILDTKLVARIQKGQLIATGSLQLKEVAIQDYAVGTLHTKVDWNLLENKLVLAGMLQKGGQQLVQIDGCYHLIKPADNLAVTTRFNQMDLDLLNPFFASVCSDIGGRLSGQFRLTGSLAAPKLNGEGIIEKGKFKINYLNTSYQVAGAIKVQENRLYADQLDLQDSALGHATLSGHMVLQDGFPLMLSGDMETFHLLHTTRIHHPDFYGDLYATGTLQMEGSIYDLLLKMKVTADKGSFTIVAHDKEDIENTTKLVQFVSTKAKHQTDTASTSEDRSAIKLILDLTILPTIKAQVLFGSYGNASDILQGQGTGTMRLEVGTNRKPYVMGNYLFQSGTYTVSVYNLIQKTFTITPNSQVNFNGYPQEGIVHIGASYKQIASITGLCPESTDKRPIPVEIMLSAYGTLAHPNIVYQLFFPVKSMDFDLNIALEECASKALLDKNYLNHQVLSLLIAKRIYNEQNIGRWSALSNSINDFVAQSIQNLVSKINHNLEIETDLGMNQSDHQEANILQNTSIKVSYLLLSEDLKLSSTVGRSSRFINDWEIAYRISKTYHMHAKLYQQPLNSASNRSLFGISFAYTKKFW
ncbi:MAG: translocation/assembly module TamB domain-containing protein [Candidatus Cardinium sp.]|uniref:translocation/assembly module TamB domain-containing protein n=1 Tax=Cardinium endosymbiont of Dermatophagoides farinae TaxID=2597823 RepID=UPI0011824AB5|nr:translocation/assembly module TamB domain-containing protein [Cardinium endosymbiont of Dermatophagoides farinae]TSJ81295.1 hypothetical protein FPG78_04885 [Cardinium endosymbiont of Dermatophagoides farinae]UWW97355.1 MAG: translocation/assembly module TamB domain-containing protein [Candidatus Cardinium sp.]